MFKLLKALNKKLHHHLWVLRYDLWIVEGSERVSGEPLILSYAGWEPYKNYFMKWAFSGHTEKFLGKVWYWDIKKEIKKHTDLNMAVYEANLEKEKFFRSNYDYKIPNWIKLEIPDFSDAVLKRDKYSIIQRRIRKNALEFEISGSIEAFDEFYRSMYAPYTKNRHEGSAIVHGYDFMRKRFVDNACEVLFVKKDGRRVGANLIDYSDGDGHLIYMGVLNGEAEWMKMGVTDAIYYFSLLRIKERGYRSVNLGHCRPFIQDGSVKYKKELGAEIASAHLAEGGFTVLKIHKSSSALDNFFANNPFVYLDPADGNYKNTQSTLTS